MGSGSEVSKREYAAGSGAGLRVVSGTGEMAERIRMFPWEETPLGGIESWSETLLATVNLVLSSRVPMQLLWGQAMTLVYNDSFAPLIPGRHPEALGQSGRKFWKDAWPVVGHELDAVLDRGEATSHSNALIPISRNGVLTDVYWTYSYTPVYGPDGAVLGILDIVQDTTQSFLAERERESAALALASERERLLSVLQQAPVCFTLLEGPDHVITMVNRLYMELAGDRDVLGKPVRLALPESVEQGYIEILDGVFREGRPFIANEARFEPSPIDGLLRAERFLDFVYQPLREADGEVSGIIVLGVDVTERKRAQEGLIKNEKLAAVGRLASSIAHEINNPLESVTNLIYLAKGSDSLAPEVREYLDIAERELLRASAITSQTLRFHKQSTRAVLVTCQDLIGSALAIQQGRFVNQHIVVEKRKRAHRPVMCLDGEIRQVLSNLIGNAIDAMPTEGGRLLVRSREGHEWRTGRAGLILTVADNGSGMSRQTQGKVFDAFFTTKGHNGTGLGMWISQEIVQRHEGRIEVRSSQKAGRSGTAFTVFLPFAATGDDLRELVVA